MPVDEDHDVELDSLGSEMEEDEEEARGTTSSNRHLTWDPLNNEDPLAAKDGFSNETYGSALNQRTVRKLDYILLPFLATLFLLNSIDKSNIGNAETAGFTRDAGLDPGDLNLSMGYFFAFFVALQPVGAALGRKVGMTRWVPACMSLWGLCTMLHIWVIRRWELISLRVAIACLEAGFYPTTVAYLSLFYTRFEFAVRLSIFYGQTAVAGVVGGILSWAIFSGYENQQPPPDDQGGFGGWKGWQWLFLIEGCLTMFVALLGFFWLPGSGESAWFFSSRERRWAEQRIRLDQDNGLVPNDRTAAVDDHTRSIGREHEVTNGPLPAHDNDEARGDEAHHRLLGEGERSAHPEATRDMTPLTADKGLSRQDILSAIMNYKIWHILACNILSAIPATAFGVFMPLVVRQMSPSLNLAPSASNLLSAPPFAFGAVMLFVFARWSDRSKRRLIPILCGLGLLLVGLTVTLLVPMRRYVLRYCALCILLSGSFIASPLTVTWITNNTPEPGKRSILLGINGWGNLGGVFLSVLFTPADRENGYIRPFIITLLCAIASFVGYVVLYFLLVRENKRREEITSGWSDDEKAREERWGDMPIPLTPAKRLQRWLGLDVPSRRLGSDGSRRGDEKMTFRYGL